MRVKGRVTVQQLIGMLKRSDFDLRLASDAAASLGLSKHLRERIVRARQETAHALRAVEAVKAQSKQAA
jgi:hypothetical protein